MWGNSKEVSSKFGHWWVDDDGAWNFWGLDRPRDPDTAETADRKFRRIALHRLGMVRVARHPSGTVVEFDLHQVDDTALDATVEFVASAGHPGPVELRFFHRAWNIESHFDAPVAVRRIQEVRRFRDVVLANTVTTLRQPLSARGMISPRVRDALPLVEDRGAKLALAECTELIPHLMIYRRNERLTLGHWDSVHAGNQSACARFFGQDWVHEARGRPFQIEEPGRRYSIKVMKPYAGVLDTGEPRLDHIRAIIRRPAKDPLWVPYQRLLFRAAAENGEPLLCCLSDITQDIAIPFMRACA
jgi:hypothetical protein